jgi:DNA polymerase-3 subunit gamma/tau
VEEKKEEVHSTSGAIQEFKNPYTDEELKNAWTEFAETRKIYQAEYQLLGLPYERVSDNVIILLHNPIQETILGTFKSDLTVFIREKLKNSFITVTSELREEENKKVIYTDRERFNFLMEKNPNFRELKERLGLDIDF